jgi:hypothetical protein
MGQAAITRIERGERKVSLDEAIAIAAVLDIAPVHLFMPIDGDGTVRLAPGLEVDQAKARRWSRGNIPLRPEDFEFYLDQTPGDVRVSAEELSEDEQRDLAERARKRLEQLGVDDQEAEAIISTGYGTTARRAPRYRQPDAGPDFEATVVK